MRVQQLGSGAEDPVGRPSKFSVKGNVEIWPQSVEKVRPLQAETPVPHKTRTYAVYSVLWVKPVKV